MKRDNEPVIKLIQQAKIWTNLFEKEMSVRRLNKALKLLRRATRKKRRNNST